VTRRRKGANTMGVDWGVLCMTGFVEALLYIWLRVEQAEER